MDKKSTYARTLRLNLNNTQHKKVHEILLAVDGSVNAFIVNAILYYENYSKASPEERIAQAVVKNLMLNGMGNLETTVPSPTPELDVEPNFDFCS